MYAFGKHSRRKLDTVDPRLVNLLEVALADKACPCDITVLCGYRGEKDQNAAFDLGNSQIRFPNGNHNVMPSNAVDVAPFYRQSPHVRWNEIGDFEKLIKHIKKIAKREKIDIVCGMDWNMKDYPHIELKKVEVNDEH